MRNVLIFIENDYSLPLLERCEISFYRQMKKQYPLPATFTIRFDKTDGNTYLLSTLQILSIPRETAFSFFEKPENLIE